VIREQLPVWLRWSLGIIPVVVLLLIWSLLTMGDTAEERMFSPTILPSPGEVIASFHEVWFDKTLLRNVFVSFSRIAGGFGLAFLIAFPLGVLMGAFTKIKAMFNPLSVFSAYLPIPALVPLTLSLFGTGETQKIAFLATAFVIYLLPLIVQAVDNVDEIYLKTAYTLGATKRQTVVHVLLSVAWQEIYQALRMGFGIGWSYIILAEIVDMQKGLGGIISVAQRRARPDHVYFVLLVIVVIAFLTDKLWGWGGKMLFPYAGEKR